MSSRARVKKMGLDNKVFIERGNLWKTDFSKFNIVTLYGISYIMPELEKKLLLELKPGSKVTSNTFKFPNWKPSKQIKDVYLYIKE